MRAIPSRRNSFFTKLNFSLLTKVRNSSKGKFNKFFRFLYYDTFNATGFMRGLVTKSTGSWYQVLGEDDKRYDCRIKGKFRTKGIKTTNPVAVGDWVHFDVEPDQIVRSFTNWNLVEIILFENPSICPNKLKLSEQTWIRLF
jgi:ribosome biogenesis GTPase